ncbi:hypothetical protein AVEN_111767-1 [Araneus ventricosus]|uniref:Uncharacterized protein n=1 Tax=Araneus ventricosus TaxID=182803 RepID=A0A4Y2FTQ6_ARAVE|nr:hypothetical protein AVEN_111767-1 [Araneus ventricosus]
MIFRRGEPNLRCFINKLFLDSMKWIVQLSAYDFFSTAKERKRRKAYRGSEGELLVGRGGKEEGKRVYISQLTERQIRAGENAASTSKFKVRMGCLSSLDSSLSCAQ